MTATPTNDITSALKSSRTMSVGSGNETHESGPRVLPPWANSVGAR